MLVSVKEIEGYSVDVADITERYTSGLLICKELSVEEEEEDVDGC